MRRPTRSDEADDDEPRVTKKAKKAKKAKAKAKNKAKKKKPARTEEDAPAIVSTAPVVEHDITPPRVTIAAEALGTMPLDGGNRDLFGFGGGIGFGAELFASALLGVHVGAAYMYLPASGSMSSTSWAGAQVGPRVHLGPQLFGAATHHDAWVDAHVSYGASGGIRRPGFDLGVGVQWELAPAVRVGPMVRYQFGSDPLKSNAQLVTVGLAVGFGGRTRTAIHIEGDADGDGLVDRVDECPQEVPGDRPDPDREGCPLHDGDDDGILDAEDECPEEPMGKRPDPARKGCPFPDRDGDEIADGDDACPDEPGPVQVGQPTSGCPLARVNDKRIEILQQIFFETNSATISESSRPVLEAIATVIKKLDGARIRIEGHTDDVGSDSYNLDLSKRRARAVALWLVENGEIDTARLETNGFGKSRPLVSGSNTDKNRRVEFVIIEAK